MKNFAAVLIAGICALLLSVCFIALLDYEEVQLQHISFRQAHSNVVQCRENLAHFQGALSVDKYCGQIPELGNFVSREVTK